MHLLQRIAILIPAAEHILGDHDETCGDWVQFLAMHPDDFELFGLVELWGIPVVAYDEVPRGRIKVLCEAEGYGMPEIENVDELLEVWDYARQRPMKAA